MHHCHGKPRRCRHHIYFTVNAERVICHKHGKGARPGGDIARTRPNGICGGHAGSCIALTRCDGDPRLKRSCRVKETRARLRQISGDLARRDRLRENISKTPRILFRFRQRFKGFRHLCVIAERFAVERENAGGFAEADLLLAGQPPVDISRQRREIADACHMFFAAEHGLIKMRDRPALRDMKAEEFRELLGRLTGNGVAPCAKWCERHAGLVQRQISVHHGRYADGAECRRIFPGSFPDIGAQIGIAALHAADDILQRICPDTVFQPVFPYMAAGGNRRMVLVEQNRFDARRPQLDAEHRSGKIQHKAHLSFQTRSFISSSSSSFSGVLPSVIWTNSISMMRAQSRSCSAVTSYESTE